MLKIAEHLDELRFDELAELYHDDLEVEGVDDRDLEPGDDWFAGMKAEFGVYLSARFFSRSERLNNVRSFYAIWEAEGKYVSAVRVHVYEQGLLLEALQTREDARGKGYAAALLGAVLAYLVQRGQFKVYAHVRDWKTQAARLLETYGFRRILDYAVRKDPYEWPPYYYRESGYLTYFLEL